MFEEEKKRLKEFIAEDEAVFKECVHLMFTMNFTIWCSLLFTI